MRFALLALLVSLSAQAADYSAHKELFMKNEAGGVVALTMEPCQFPEAVKKGFKERSYATEGDGTKHEGCWMTPEIKPEELPAVDRHVVIIPLVNLWYDEQIIAYPQHMFTPGEI